MEDGYWAQLSHLLKGQALDQTTQLETFFVTIFESGKIIFDLEDSYDVMQSHDQG